MCFILNQRKIQFYDNTFQHLLVFSKVCAEGGDENKNLFQGIFHNSFHFQKLSIKLLMSHEINVQYASLAAVCRVNLEHLLSFSFVEVLLLSV